MATLEELRATTQDGALPAFAWPGGYPIVYETENGLGVCATCADRETDGDPVIAGDIYFEGPTLRCDDCATPIESAYGDPEAA